MGSGKNGSGPGGGLPRRLKNYILVKVVSCVPVVAKLYKSLNRLLGYFWLDKVHLA